MPLMWLSYLWPYYELVCKPEIFLSFLRSVDYSPWQQETRIQQKIVRTFTHLQLCVGVHIRNPNDRRCYLSTSERCGCFDDAQSRAVLPCASCTVNRPVDFLTRTLHTSSWPFSAALWSAVLPSLSTMVQSAPLSKRSLTHSKCPWWEARCKAVAPPLVCKSVWAPCLSSSSVTLAWPCLHE